MPLTPTLEATLRAIRHARGRLVFCNPDGKPLTLWQLHERLWGTCRRAGLRRIRWHDCRHSFASQLVIGGTPLRQVQEWLRHSTITMTMRLCARPSPKGPHEESLVPVRSEAKYRNDRRPLARHAAAPRRFMHGRPQRGSAIKVQRTSSRFRWLSWLG